MPDASATTDRSVDIPTFEHRATAVARAVSFFGIMPAMIVGVVLALLAAPLVGLVAAVFVAVVWAVVVRLRARSALDRLLSGLGAAPSATETSPRWANVVDGVGVTSGVDDVELMVLDRPEANALAAASAERRVIVVTSGLVEQLSLIEMEGVAANLLGRLKDGSARYGTVMYGLLGPLLNGIEPAGRLLADGLGEQRSVQTDLAAVRITRYPPGLAAALEHLDGIGTVIPGADASTAHLWLAPVCSEGAGVAPAVAETALQPLSYRAAVLGEL